MTVRVNIHHYLFRDAAGPWVITETNGKTLGECLGQTVAKFPRLKNEVFDPAGKLQGHVLVFLNGEDASPDELTRKVSDGDVVEMIPIIGGG
ncbi:MAG: MoaD/ThiS family protein [Chloroflexota bacterium]